MKQKTYILPLIVFLMFTALSAAGAGGSHFCKAPKHWIIEAGTGPGGAVGEWATCTEVPAPTETSTPTGTATLVPTSTAVPPTDTPSPTNTAVPPTATAAATATPGPGQPCPHPDNSTFWHGVMGPSGCFYRHEHGHDPNLGNDVFGPPGAWYGGGELSGPHQTTAENQYKHEAYNLMVELNIPRPAGAFAWIRDFRIQSHVTSAPFNINDVLSGGYLGRVHSAVIEVNVCDADGVCGVNRAVGWFDFGCLIVNNQVIPLSPDEVCDNSGPKRVHFDSNHAANCCTQFFWYGKNHPQAANPVQIGVASFDTATDVNIADPFSLDFICDQINPYDCQLNDSTRQAHLIVLFPTPGMRTGLFFADRYGRAVEGCTEISLDCLPNEINYPLAFQLQFREDGYRGGQFYYEFDDCLPDNPACIGYPN